MKPWLLNFGKILGVAAIRLSRPFVVLCFSALVGILVGDKFPQISPWVWATAAVSLLGYLSFSRLGRWKFFLAGMVTFAFLQSGAEHVPVREMLLARQGRPLPVTVVGMVADAPEPDMTGRSWSFPLKVETLQNYPCQQTKLYVRIHGAMPPDYGDRIQLHAQLELADKPRNPGEFDWAQYLHRQGFAAELNATGAANLSILERTGGNSIVRASMRAREWLGKTVTAGLEDDPALAATVRTMVLGTQESTPQDIEDAFVESGTMHVFAVSGLHIALFGLVAWQVLRLLRVPRSTVVMLVIPMMFFYVFVTGMRSSAWRAAVMAAVVLIGPLLNRTGSPFNSLAFAALILLGWDTQQLFQPGFQLSFGVVFALAMFTNPLYAALARWYKPDPFIPFELLSRSQILWSNLRRNVAKSLCLSLCATLGSAPLMIQHFGLITPIGLVSNLFLVPVSEMILVIACLSVICAGIQCAWLSLWANNANWAMAKCSIFLAKFFASVPGGHVRVNADHWFDPATAHVTVLTMRGGAAATHLDMGGRHWMLDAGPAAGYLRTVRPYLLSCPISKLQGLILTHRDADHIGGHAPLCELFQPRDIIGPNVLQKNASLPMRLPARGETIPLASNSSYSILYPPPELAYGPADDQCFVVLFIIDGWRLLFTSDAGFIAEKWLLENQIDCRADVLIKGLHPGDFSGLPEFINAVQPKVVCFSNHAFPEFQRVADDWIQWLERKGLPYFDQRQSGAVEISLTSTQLALRGFVDEKSVQLHR